MDLGLSGKVALITASSGGIGMNVAKRLASEGADVVLLARSAEKLETLAATFRDEYGVRALPVVGSMLETCDHDRLFAAIKDEFGRLDIAILNTGLAAVAIAVGARRNGSIPMAPVLRYASVLRDRDYPACPSADVSQQLGQDDCHYLCLGPSGDATSCSFNCI